MKLHFQHDSAPYCLQAEAPDRGDLDPPFIHLDCGLPTDAAHTPGGPRLSIRALKKCAGWRILIHPDGGDPTHCFTVKRGTRDRAAVITADENNLS